MPETQKIQITDGAHISLISEWSGLARADVALDAAKMDKLPGFGLAVAIVARELAEAKSQAMTSNLKAIARAGIDICQTKNISLSFERGIPILHVEMLDLAEMGEPENG